MSTAPSLLAPDTYEHTVGMPRMFQDIAAFRAMVAAYFEAIDALNALPGTTRPKPYTMHGLARALGCTRVTLLNYERYTDQPSFIAAIKDARERVAEWTEARLHERGYHPAGAIFSLKNNFGWKDTQDVSVHIGVAIGLQVTDAQRLALVPQVVLDQLSPPPVSCVTLSPGECAPVTEAHPTAKATPYEGVSPRSVA